jgi:hypothetical protein
MPLKDGGMEGLGLMALLDNKDVGSAIVERRDRWLTKAFNRLLPKIKAQHQLICILKL